MAGTGASDLRARFIEAMSRVAATVNIVTTDGPAGRHGITVSAMSSVSADGDNPVILVCVNKQSRAAEPILRNGCFCVNILRDDQAHISDVFAGRQRDGGIDRFAGLRCERAPTGTPRFADALVSFDCKLLSAQTVGTHHVLFGAVEDVILNGIGAPLIYTNRAYGTPLRLRSGQPELRDRDEVLKLGAFHTLGPYLLPRILRHLVATDRTIDLQILEGDRASIQEGLQDGSIEIALVYDWDLGSEIQNERLCAFRPYALVADGDPLSCSGAVSLAQLSSRPLILLDRPPSARYFLSLFEERGLQATVRYRTSSLEMVRGMVANGLGYSLLVTKPASDMAYDGERLRSLDIIESPPVRYAVLSHRRDRPLSEPAHTFLDACCEIFRRTENVPGLCG